MAAVPALAFAQANVSVNVAQTVRTVDDRLFGINAVMWDGNTATAQTISLVEAAGLRFIRFPGGSNSDEYHWNVNKSLTNTWTWAAASDKFTTLITSVGAQATGIVNYGTGTPEEAAAWVAYFNSPATLVGTASDVQIGTDSNGTNWQTAGAWSAMRAAAPLATDDGSNFLRQGRSTPVGVKYWEIGNEIYGTWETDQQTVKHDPYTYATRAKAYIAKMKAVDPTVKIGVVAVTGEDSYTNNTSHPATNPRTGAVHNGWTPVMLATLKSLGVTPDFLIYHRYDQNPGQENDASLLQGTRTWSDDAASLRQQLTDYLGAAGANVELIVTENNSVSSNPGKQATSIVDGLFYADTFGNVLQTEIGGYMWWALRNGPPSTANESSSLYGWRQYGDYGVLSTPSTGGSTSYYEAYPTYFMMKLVSHFVRGGDTVVKASSDNSLVAAYAAKHADGTVTVLLINKSPTADTSVNLSFPGFSPGASATVYTYGVAQDNAAQSGTGTNDVVSSTITNAGSTFSITVPHYTADVISLAASAPQIIVQPAPGTISTNTGANIVLAVAATGGSGALSYQWRKDGTALAGATGSAVTLSNVTAANAGNYSVAVTDGNGTSVSSNATPVVVAATPYTAPASELFNISTRAQVGTSSNVMVAGLTVGGSGAKKVLIRAVGPTLGAAPFNLSGVLADPQLQLTTLSGAVIASNDDWGNSPDAAAIAAASHAMAFDLVAGSKDSAMIVTLPAGGYTAIVQGANSTTGIALIEVYDLDTTSAARLTNVSTRALVGPGDQQMIAGFVVHGATPLKLLVRGVGPWLAPYVSGALADPQLTIKTLSGTSLVSDDNWEDNGGGPAIIAADSATGAFALASGSKDAAIVTSLSDGLYTPALVGANGTSGVGLVEVYEVP